MGALLFTAGHGGGLGGEGVPSVAALGDEHEADERQHRDGALEEQDDAVHGQHPGDEGGSLLGQGPGLQDEQHEGGQQGQERDGDLQAAAPCVGHEGLEEHGEHAGAEHDQERGEQPPVQGRRL